MKSRMLSKGLAVAFIILFLGFNLIGFQQVNNMIY